MNDDILAGIGISGDRLLSELGGKDDAYLGQVDARLGQLIERHLSIAESAAAGDAAQRESLRKLDAYIQIQRAVDRTRYERKRRG